MYILYSINLIHYFAYDDDENDVFFRRYNFLFLIKWDVCLLRL